MSIVSRIERLHIKAKSNRWLRYFAVFNRIALAAGFIIAGMVKIMGERFASGLSVNHPMGNYLEALYHTGYYYTFIGIMQVVAAFLLLIPRTTTLGAILYFPIILNICILSFAVRFDGSLFSSPLMVLANLYLLCWDYDKMKFIIFFKRSIAGTTTQNHKNVNNKFPMLFFGSVAATIVILVFGISSAYKVMPHNNISDCKRQFIGTNRIQAGNHFCDCIFNDGKPLNTSLDEYKKAPDDPITRLP